MSDLRPTVDHNQVLALLSQHFSSSITELAPVEGGQVARTFSFRAYEELAQLLSQRAFLAARGLFTAQYPGSRWAGDGGAGLD